MADETNSGPDIKPDSESNETDESTTPKISIIIKTAKEKEAIEISQDASISEVSCQSPAFIRSMITINCS